MEKNKNSYHKKYLTKFLNDKMGTATDIRIGEIRMEDEYYSTKKLIIPKGIIFGFYE